MEKLEESFPRRTVVETVLLEGNRKWKMSFLQLDSSFPSSKIFLLRLLSVSSIRSVGFSFEVLRLRRGKCVRVSVFYKCIYTRSKGHKSCSQWLEVAVSIGRQSKEKKKENRLKLISFSFNFL